jgi:hypothetical protein
MATSMKDLEALHKLITKSYTDRIQQDLDDNIPTDAATLSGAVKLLKDNAVTADPASTDDLSDLRDKLKEAAETRRKKVGSVMSLVESDMKAMEA